MEERIPMVICEDCGEDLSQREAERTNWRHDVDTDCWFCFYCRTLPENNNFAEEN